MSITTAPQPTFGSRGVFVAMTIALAALAVAIILPLVLHSTKTVVQRVSSPSTSGSSAPSSYNPDTLRMAHGG